MRYRVEADGGVFTLDSTPGEGTCVRARLPLAVTQEQASQAAGCPRRH